MTVKVRYSQGLYARFDLVDDPDEESRLGFDDRIGLDRLRDELVEKVVSGSTLFLQPTHLIVHFPSGTEWPQEEKGVVSWAYQSLDEIDDFEIVESP